IVARDNNGAAAEYTALRASGEEFPVEVSISKIAGDQGGLVLLVARDIGERKRSEQRLKQLARALEQSANLVIVCNADGSVDYVNPRFLSATGYDRNELIGRLPFFWQNQAKGAVNEQVWSTVLSGQDWRGEFENVTKEGKSIPVSVTISPV